MVYGFPHPKNTVLGPEASNTPLTGPVPSSTSSLTAGTQHRLCTDPLGPPASGNN